MSGRGGTRIRATSKPVIVLAGEDSNDRRILRILLERFCPQMNGRLVEINDSVRLRGASDGTLADRVRTLARKARAKAAFEGTQLACLFVHEDFDRPDGDEYVKVRDRVQAALVSELDRAHYVLAVWEIEAWLMLFPDALAGVTSSWKIPNQYRNRDTGSLNDPKKILIQSFARSGRRYRESDAPDAFGKAVDLNCLDQPIGTNRSWKQLRADATACCQQHIPQMRRPQ